ncbi:hypothetical protein RM590_03765 [Streptomyces sp. DSM 44938]|uniref:Uncharacterized protein n=1 Tax=Streptomyces litchfieldiae TaxID=3075543 RepID=A0ABU2MJV6_9ACTN|nr:hypothetical protein [Streptomyces sp. DSM 44938]
MRGDRTHSWPLGPQGVASAVHVKGSLCPSAARNGWLGISKGPINNLGGCLHLCDSAGQALACLALSDWVPNGAAVITMDRPDTFPAVKNNFKAEEFLELSGMGPFLRHFGVPVHESVKEPPRARRFAGTLRPGPRMAGSPLLTILAFAQLVVLVLATFFTGGIGDRAGQVMVAGAFLAFALLEAGWSLLLGILSARREKPAVAELRPSPGVPVPVVFRKRASIRLVGDALELRTAQNVKRLIQPPADPVLGLREVVVLEDNGRPWGVALTDGREVVQAFLHWDTWFAGDPQLTHLRAFCAAVGLNLRRQALGAFPGRQERDHTAKRFRMANYALNDTFAISVFSPSVAAFGVYPMFIGAVRADIEWPPYYIMFGLSFAIGFAPYVVRGAVRKWSLNRMVPPAPVSNVEFRGMPSNGGEGAATL